MEQITIERALETLGNPYNLIALAYMIIMLAVWWSARFWQTPKFVEKRAIFLNPRWTILLQKKFRSKTLDDITSAIWFWGFTFTIIFMWVIALFQADRAWRIGVAVLGTVSTSLSIQFLFPVIVPIRYPDFNKPTQEFEAIRLITHESTDVVNGLLYNGAPSNHFGMMFSGMSISLYVYSYDPWFVWLLFGLFFLVMAIIFAFSVIYLGEHYPQDMLLSLVVYPIGLIIFYSISLLLVPV